MRWSGLTRRDLALLMDAPRTSPTFQVDKHHRTIFPDLYENPLRLAAMLLGCAAPFTSLVS
ncbi:MAG TPA: hypothetical protein PK777_04905 [Thermoguttaceae bacterium]|nr:hypothetical protein [Thermoguttaceae bacterium]HPP52270.1 hypothetical protein [Thermoguttaceae bacterium]